MDECFLDDLLECSVCLERLDVSSKVLPCQHTFCKSCLQEILKTHNELRCPECRVPVETSIDDLPPNVLLMRILESIKNTSSDHSNSPASRNQNVNGHSNKKSLRDENKPQKFTVQPCAEAIYDYLSKEPGDLSFRKGDIIYLRRKIDNNWYHGECSGKTGVFPLSYVQIIEQLPTQIPQCKALYDFKMANDEEEGCLAFTKGEVLTVIRRVDENWAEGKLGERIGIFPIAFVEFNAAAGCLMKLNFDTQPGPSRLAPPTPTSNVETPTQLAASASSHRIHPPEGVPANTCSPLSGVPISSTSQSSPSSPPNASQQPGVPNKRHSFGSTLQTDPQVKSKRHSAEIILQEEQSSLPSSLNPADMFSLPKGFIDDRTDPRHRQKRINELLPQIPGPHVQHSSLQLPAPYVALYPYKPQKADELELKRGAIYTVTERCQDGWFKGFNIRNHRTGVFPGNYVAPSKSLAALQVQVRALCRSKNSNLPGSSRNGTPPLEPRAQTIPPPVPVAKSNDGSRNVPVSSVIPPPNVSVQASTPISVDKEKKDKGVGLMRRLASIKKCKSPPPGSYSMDNPVFEDAPSLTPVPVPVHTRSGSCPNQLLSSSNPMFSPTLPQRNKPRGMTRMSPSVAIETISNIQHRKSSSMDNALVPSESSSPIPLLPPFVVRHSPEPSSSKIVPPPRDTSAVEIKSKTKPELKPSRKIIAEKVYICPTKPSRVQLREASPPKSTSPSSSPASCESSSQPLSRQGNTIPRERFRCIVPYPPNSEYELELQLGDVIFVHKKRQDGWYKGTQQRTGRTGLFPASFVQSF